VIVVSEKAYRMMVNQMKALVGTDTFYHTAQIVSEDTLFIKNKGNPIDVMDQRSRSKQIPQ
jgi:hypothetical protein